MTTTATTMASTKAITQIKSVRYELGALYAALAFCSLLNLFLTLTPVAKSNASIDDRLQKSVSLPTGARLILFNQLLKLQEDNLARKPSEPYGWSRLAYLRMMLHPNDPKDAFAALQMSDLISPYEAPQLPERAGMWLRLQNVETPDQRAYQDILWTKAYGMERDTTWALAVHNNIDKQVGEALKRTSPALYEEWKAREASKR
jgi:hypothetical protein